MPSRVNVRLSTATAAAACAAIRCADSTLPASFQQLAQTLSWLPAGGVDAIVTDPPYCLLRRRQKSGQVKSPPLQSRHRKLSHDTVARYDSVRQYHECMTQKWLDAALPRLKPAGVLIIWTNALGKSGVERIAAAKGFHLHGEYVWAKHASDRAARAEHSSANEVRLRVYETALVLGAGPPSPPPFSSTTQGAPQLGPGPDQLPVPWAVITGYHDQSEGGEQEGGRPAMPHPHPHHKPFAALEPLLRAWTRNGDTVLDPFAGSGAICAAAVRLGRRAVGMEVDPFWVGVANEAVAEASRRHG